MEQVKLSYSASLRRVKVAIKPEHCRKGDKLALEMLRRAQQKCESEVKAGRFDIFHLYEADFLKLWKLLGEGHELPADRWIHFTLAQGGRRISGIEVLADSTKNFFTLSANLNQNDLKHLSWSNFLVNIQVSLKAKDFKLLPHEGMLRSIFLTLKNGEAINKLRVKTISEQEAAKLKSFGFTLNTERQEAYLYLNHKNLFQKQNASQEVLKRADKIITQVKQKFPQAAYFRDELALALRNMSQGPEQAGVQLPRIILIAASHGNKLSAKTQASQPANQASGKAKTSPRNNASSKVSASAKKAASKKSSDWLFQFDIDELGMEAKIKAYNKYKLFENPDGMFGREDMIRELKKAGIRACYEPFLEKILNLIALESNLEGQPVARGEPAVQGEHPYLHPVYLDNKPGSEDLLIEDLRSAQNKRIVKKGDVIAEVRYSDGTPGRNVFGEVVHILAHESILNLTIGSGVVKGRDGQFLAAIDGMPIIDDNKIDCSPVYIHDGDVNLSSGNVIFDGSAEILGNIEAGATVIVTGHLSIKGTIGRAFVRCGGDLNVQGGILAGGAGWIESGGNMYAEFIENAKVTAGGNLDVKTSIMNSYVIVGDSLRMRDLKEGTIGGGHISVRNLLHTANLGFADGKKTICKIGVDWLLERKIAIQESRLERIAKAFDVEKRNVEELQSKKFRNAEHNRLLEIKSKKVNRMSQIIRKIERKIAFLVKLVNWNRDAMVKVQEKIVRNVDLVVGGKAIPIGEEMKAVLITYHKYRDTRINPLEAYEAFQKSRGLPSAS